MAWTARLWACTPASLEGAPQIEQAPDDLGPVIGIAARDYLPYLAANARAVSTDQKRLRFRADGAAFEVPANPYRAHCLAALQQAFQTLDKASMAFVALAIGEQPPALLDAPDTHAPLPRSKRPLSRQWSPS